MIIMMLENTVHEPPVWDASLSTMWARKNFATLGDFLKAARQLGFARIELNHQVNSAMLEGSDLHQVQIISIHEPCPADISTETLKEQDWTISAEDDEKRWQGVQAVKRSIDLAHDLGAGTIVVHAGNVLTDLTLENKMRTLYEAKHKVSEEYLALKYEHQKMRNALAETRLKAVKRSLSELLDYARRFGIRLGIENRYHYLDIPIPDEMEMLLDLASPDQLGFIYDVGHAQALDQLGFFPHQEWLDRFSTRMIGVHLHDVMGVEDHRAPGSGEVDFNMIAAFLPKEAFRTLELHPKTTQEQIRTSLQYLYNNRCISTL
jgi:sugar phosphate isomerase/epimerase